MLLVHRIELQPNKEQAAYFASASELARRTFNWALGRWKSEYEAGRPTNALVLDKEWTCVRDLVVPWHNEIAARVPRQAIKNLGLAFEHFFRRAKDPSIPPKEKGYPKFKAFRVYDSFRADNGSPKAGKNALKVEGKLINLSKIGWVRMRECLRFDGQIRGVTVSRQAEKWFAAILVDTETLPHIRKDRKVVGVDLGIKSLATLSTGEKVDGPKPYNRQLARIRRLNRSLSRKKKGSSNSHKARMKLAKLHARVHDMRTDALHKLTTDLVLNNTVIGIEDLNVAGMHSNRRLARHLSDQSFSEFRRQLEYKAGMYGSVVVKVNQWYLSTKQCSECGAINAEVTLGVDAWTCDCGARHDRDHNAAINLKNVAASSAVTACGPEGLGRRDEAGRKASHGGRRKAE